MTWLVAFLLLFLPALSQAVDYRVTYNPYANVVWSTTLRCLSQTHDHVADSVSFVSSYDDAGYCAITAADYSGAFRAMTAGEWALAGNPNPDPGVHNAGWQERRWPPQDFGQPTMPQDSLQFYIHGGEEIYSSGTSTMNITQHLYAVGDGGLLYVEGEGCTSCGQSSVPVHNNNPHGLTAGQLASGANGALLQNDGITKLRSYGGLVTMNHPFSAGGVTAFDPYTNTPDSLEVFNNYHQLWDEGSANNGALATGPSCDGTSTRPWNTAYIAFFSTLWDYWLHNRSARIWGVAVNDHGGPYEALGNGHNTACWPSITTANRDRGKLEVLIPAYTLADWLTAYDLGAFFAIKEDNATKKAYPQVTDINVEESESIQIVTAAGTETITWKSNGSTLGTGSTFALTGLPSGLHYVRAEITDGAGRTLWVQPFELSTALPVSDALPLCETQL